jgi:hypothetical protein
MAFVLSCDPRPRTGVYQTIIPTPALLRLSSFDKALLVSVKTMMTEQRNHLNGDYFKAIAFLFQYNVRTLSFNLRRCNTSPLSNIEFILPSRGKIKRSYDEITFNKLFLVLYCLQRTSYL